ncbi:MAG: fluoride efflux transporter FluC, partial [Candidatus Hinthialibacter sp.]
SLARYGLAGLVQRLDGVGFAWGTPVVNLSGCFFFGLIWSLAEERIMISGETRAIVLTGFMGAFTTFSTYIFETGELLRDAQYGLAAWNIGFQTVGGLFLFFMGLAAGRYV